METTFFFFGNKIQVFKSCSLPAMLKMCIILLIVKANPLFSSMRVFLERNCRDFLFVLVVILVLVFMWLFNGILLCLFSCTVTCSSCFYLNLNAEVIIVNQVLCDSREPWPTVTLWAKVNVLSVCFIMIVLEIHCLLNTSISILLCP